MLRRQFAQLQSDVRAELGRSDDPSVRVSDLPALKHKINQVYEEFYALDWPHLKKVDERIALQAGQRFYDVPDTVDFDRIEQVHVWVNGQPVPIDRGITMDDYGIYDSENDDRSDPALKWDIRYDSDGNEEQIEIWPVPASDDVYEVQFISPRKFARLVNDADIVHLDDQLIIQQAAGELEQDEKEARKKLAKAQQRLAVLRANSAGQRETVRIGLGAQKAKQNNRTVVRIAGA